MYWNNICDKVEGPWEIMLAFSVADYQPTKCRIKSDQQSMCERIPFISQAWLDLLKYLDPILKKDKYGWKYYIDIPNKAISSDQEILCCHLYSHYIQNFKFEWGLERAMISFSSFCSAHVLFGGSSYFHFLK